MTGSSFDLDAFYRAALDAIDDTALYVVDKAGRVMTWNRGAEVTKGYAADEVIGRTVEMFYTADDVVRGVPFDELRIAEQRGYFSGLGLRVRSDGSVFRARFSLRVLRADDGSVMGYARDSRPTEAIDQLAWTGTKVCPDSIVLFAVDRDCNFTSATTAACRLFGGMREDLAGTSIGDVTRSQSRAAFLSGLPELLRRGGSVAYVAYDPEAFRWYWVHGRREATGASILLRDITTDVEALHRSTGK
jgi:PAS domain S-box-containing protein